MKINNNPETDNSKSELRSDKHEGKIDFITIMSTLQSYGSNINNAIQGLTDNLTDKINMDNLETAVEFFDFLEYFEENVELTEEELGKDIGEVLPELYRSYQEHLRNKK